MNLTSLHQHHLQYKIISILNTLMPLLNISVILLSVVFVECDGANFKYGFYFQRFYRYHDHVYARTLQEKKKQRVPMT
jgi:hypothetical protein